MASRKPRKYPKQGVKPGPRGRPRKKCRTAKCRREQAARRRYYLKNRTTIRRKANKKYRTDKSHRRAQIRRVMATKDKYKPLRAAQHRWRIRNDPAYAKRRRATKRRHHRKNYIPVADRRPGEGPYGRRIVHRTGRGRRART